MGKIRRLQLYQNGKPDQAPVAYSYNANRVRGFPALLKDCGRMLSSQVSQLYTMDGKRLTTEEDLERIGSDDLVCAGPRQTFQWATRQRPSDNNRRVAQKGAGGRSRRRASSVDNSRRRQQKRSPRRDKSQSATTYDTRSLGRAKGGKADFKRSPSEASLRPYTSYLDLNKRSFGEGQSRVGEWEQTIVAFKIKLIKSGDDAEGPDGKPKEQTYFFRSRLTKTMEALFVDLATVCPPVDGGPVYQIVRKRGRKPVTKLKHLQPDETYYVCGETFFEEKDKKDKKNRGRSRRGRSRGRSRSRSRGRSRSSRRSSRSVSRLDGLDPIDERKDQTNPDNLMIYVFLNGHGLESKPFRFTKFQVERGMPWIIENASKPYQVDGRQITTMDGMPIAHVSELFNRGSYVLIPAVQKFKPVWYHLQGDMLDTSKEPNNPEKAKETDNNKKDSGYGRGSGRSPSSSADQHRGSRRRQKSRSRSSSRGKSAPATGYRDRRSRSSSRHSSRGRSRSGSSRGSTRGRNRSRSSSSRESRASSRSGRDKTRRSRSRSSSGSRSRRSRSSSGKRSATPTTRNSYSTFKSRFDSASTYNKGGRGQTARSDYSRY